MTLARALAGQPSLLILDEPTASLSAAEAERLFVLVDALRRDGVAILLVSHRLGDLRRIADRAAIVRDGRIVADLAAPIDFDAAVETMIGRPLPRTRASVPERAGNAGAGAGPGFSVRQMRLTPTSTPFDLDVRRGEIVAIAGCRRRQVALRADDLRRGAGGGRRDDARRPDMAATFAG